jgi:CheY-like chemotaxis protein
VDDRSVVPAAPSFLRAPVGPAAPAVARREAAPSDDEASFEVVEPGKRVVVVVEDDDDFAQIVARTAKDSGFQGIVATTAERGFQLAKRFVPAGIVLDIRLPDHSGLSLLDRLKRDPTTRHVPVHVISASDRSAEALAMGAAGYLLKPVTAEQLVQAFKRLEERGARGVRRVLVVEDDVTLRESLAKLLGRSDLEISTAATVEDALVHLKKTTFDCVVTDLSLPGRSGYDLLATMASQGDYSVPPVIVYTGRVLDPDDEQSLRKYSRSIILKGARSPERLLDEVTLFLHQVEAELPAEQQRLLKQARSRESVFEGRKIMIVEDDVRNVFALTSLLEPKGAKIVIARNGREALAALDKDPRMDLVLMDIMMPEMDGLEATRAIRRNSQWRNLPVIALTAKAMKDDQERCIAAGANDFVAKPIDIEMLLSLLRVWMPKA